ncbi:MAG: TIGR00153 family protein [Ruminobacter sp.]|jgi:predicted phosphate transport protein (TIGR00153 family)|uniref:TIGR00153 family protein n=1 Tax=Ruminobacter sp. TaxID=2774296 RepID=UPI001B098A94|nr:TIGR00153 family protein [Ruminobacter sp.]MBO6009303.1 TIGR00153 family protein [Ruminobacter sp.]MBP3748608.1 TIGR00153 family protein [Ruminobacter sp.]
MQVNFLNLFAKSPLKPLYEHINNIYECCSHLPPFFDGVFSNDWDKAAGEQQQICKFERAADVIKKDIRINLPNSLFMPVDRTYLLELVTQEDKIANIARDISGLMLGRQLTIPAEIKEDFLKYLNRSIEAVELTKKVINELEDLLESGFRGKELTLVQSMVKEIDLIEDDTDHMQINLRRQIYIREKDLNPIDAMFIYKILEKVGDLADQALRVGSRLELMITKS